MWLTLTIGLVSSIAHTSVTSDLLSAFHFPFPGCVWGFLLDCISWFSISVCVGCNVSVLWLILACIFLLLVSTQICVFALGGGRRWGGGVWWSGGGVDFQLAQSWALLPLKSFRCHYTKTPVIPIKRSLSLQHGNLFSV